MFSRIIHLRHFGAETPLSKRLNFLPRQVLLCSPINDGLTVQIIRFRSEGGDPIRPSQTIESSIMPTIDTTLIAGQRDGKQLKCTLTHPTSTLTTTVYTTTYIATLKLEVKECLPNNIPVVTHKMCA